MSTEQTKSLFEFPCQFPIKIIADHHNQVTEFLFDIFKKYVPSHDKIDFETKESKTGKYMSITIIFEASSKEQLDNIYKEISSHPKIRMVL